MSQPLQGTLEEFGQRLETVKLQLTDAKLDFMILLAENQILAAQIETERKTLLAQDSTLANLSQNLHECSLISSENSTDKEEVEKLRQRNEELRQRSKELLEGVTRRNHEIGNGHQETERMSRRMQLLELDWAWW